MNLDDRLRDVAAQLQDGRRPTATVRELLGWHDSYRRGYWIVQGIRNALKRAKLRTEPDFESAYIDSVVRFIPEPPVAPAPLPGELPQATQTPEAMAPFAPAPDAAYADPTYRVSKLAAANKPPVSIAPDATVNEAVTLMLSNDFSQLPVMTSDREVKGVISWRSVGSRLALGKESAVVRELMDQHHEIRSDVSLFSAISIIAEHQYVLIRGDDGRITGIVTSSDLSLQFRQLAEPFLLLGEIENHVRRLIDDRFTVEELGAARDPADADRVVNGVADLTFGEYLRLLENPERWAKLGLKVDRKTFITKLDKIREIRNDVMHFDPDGIPDDDLESLRDFTRFLQRLQTIGVT